MSENQVAGIRRFVERGGSLVATGDTSLFNEWGDMRSDYALADLFGAHFKGSRRATLIKVFGRMHIILICG